MENRVQCVLVRTSEVSIKEKPKIHIFKNDIIHRKLQTNFFVAYSLYISTKCYD